MKKRFGDLKNRPFLRPATLNGRPFLSTLLYVPYHSDGAEEVNMALSKKLVNVQNIKLWIHEHFSDTRTAEFEDNIKYQFDKKDYVHLNFLWEITCLLFY